MRPARMIGSVALVFGLTFAVQAQPGEATITVPVEVRSGPSDKFYPTSKLKAGDKVQIVDQKEFPWLAGKMPPSGWLAIRPPMGSYSWINNRFLNISSPDKPVADVLTDDVPVRTGSTLYDGRPTVEWVKLSRGATVIIGGKKEVDAVDNSVWVPIAPTEREVRFIPAEAVKATTPVQTVSSAPPPAVAPAAPPGAVIPAPPAPAAAHEPTDPLWMQAKKAEQEGKLDEAIRLYQQLANQTTDHQLNVNCLNQINFIKMGHRDPMSPSAPTGAGQARLTPTPAYPYGAPVTAHPGVPGPATSQYTYEREGMAPPTNPPPPASSGYAPAGAPATPGWIGPGCLTTSICQVGGQRAYRFYMGEGKRIPLVVPSAGLALEPYLNRRVYLKGLMGYHAGYHEYMIAEQVSPVP